MVREAQLGSKGREKGAVSPTLIIEIRLNPNESFATNVLLGSPVAQHVSRSSLSIGIFLTILVTYISTQSFL